MNPTNRPPRETVADRDAERALNFDANFQRTLPIAEQHAQAFADKVGQAVAVFAGADGVCVFRVAKFLPPSINVVSTLQPKSRPKKGTVQ